MIVLNPETQTDGVNSAKSQTYKVLKSGFTQL